MKKFFLILLLLFRAALLAQSTVTASFTASVTVMEPIKITTISNLNFANVRAGTGGEIIIRADGQRKGFGNVELVEDNGVSPASFNISGKRGTKVNVILPEGIHYLSNGYQKIIIKDFSSNWNADTGLEGNNNILKVGASIVLEDGQDPGIYTSLEPLEIIVNYN